MKLINEHQSILSMTAQAMIPENAPETHDPHKTMQFFWQFQFWYTNRTDKK